MHAIKLGSAQTCCQQGNVSSLVSNDCCLVCGNNLWEQPYFISESWANVDGFQKSDVRTSQQKFQLERIISFFCEEV
jgi:hypothetical protein